MTRLIDANKLKKDLESATLSNGTLLNTNTVLALLDKYPTVYDVDKVVEELNKIKKYNLNLADMMIDIQENGTNRHFICLENAIEIVKAGATNESQT
jgi:hypothetical protein